MKKQARFWTPTENKTVHCQLCPHACTIAQGKRGICGVRQNDNGTLNTLIYASCSSIAADPIEKKPLYHFHPGTQVLSLGSVGCTFRCAHCQNYQISTAGPTDFGLEELPPDQVVQTIKDYGCEGVAWTYNEPTIWHEYTVDSARLVKKAGLYTVYVTNGFIQEDPLRDIAPYLDAMNIDVKAFTEEFYHKTCKARLAPVLRTCELAKQLGIHLELTYLVIPNHNDTPEETKKFCDWVATKLGIDTPVHFSRFHPDYQMTDTPATPVSTLLDIYKKAKQAGLQNVYLGNISHGEYDNTTCPRCGSLLIERHGFSATSKGLKQDQCIKCHTKILLKS